MNTKFSPKTLHDLTILKRDKTKVFKKIKLQLALFEANPKHPSLRTHKLKGNLKNRWSISITRNFRMIYLLEKEDQAYFIDIGTHDEVYKK